MNAAMESILHNDKGLREAARLYNIPVETLRRHDNGSVEVGARPEPDEEKNLLAKYVEMPDMGYYYGFTQDTVMEFYYC